MDGSKSAIIADLKDSMGQLVGSNQVIYPDAFDGIKADVRYTYTKGGFEQDIVLRQQPPAPEQFGFNPKTTRLEVLTEFFDAPEPELSGGVIDEADNLQDVGLKFGSMRMILGKAFSTADAQQKIVEGATVFKDWLTVQGRTFLIEKLPYKNIAPQLQKLPLQASNDKAGSSVKMAMVKPSSIPTLSPLRPVQACTNSILLAKADYNQNPGVVLDYVVLGSVVGNYTFQADTTYLMASGPGTYFEIDGLATFEGGTVIKFTNSTAGFILQYANVSFQTSPYRPLILTASDDNTVGETISGSTGNPSGYYGNGITIYGNPVVLHDIKMSYLGTGLIDWAGGEINNVQAINCSTPITHGFVDITIKNGLFYNIGGTAVLCQGSSTSVSGSQLTIDNVATFADSTTASLTLNNSLVTATTNLLAGTGTLTTNSVTILTNNAGIYQVVGAGSHYLATNSPYRGVGTTNINASLLASLRSRTTYPPLIYSNQTFTVSTNLQIQAKRDTNASPDLGYHYDPLDYITDGVTLTNNATLTVLNGIAIACYNRTGISLQGGASIVSIGTPLLPNWFVRYQSVQDQSVFLGGTNISSGQNISASPVGSARPNATIQFTHFATPANGGFDFYHNGNTAFNNLTIQHSELWGGTNDFSGPTNTATVLLQNNLFYRSGINASNSSASASLTFTNNMIYGTVISLGKPATGSWYFFNNDVDSCTIPTNSAITNGYNAFINCSSAFTGTSNIVSTNAIGYQTGPLGGFYQPTNSPLLNVGSPTADLVALYHFTTQTNQVKETNSVVDIGYHYVALNTNGIPFDTNGDGVPDYVADANGNGLVDGGELSWDGTADQSFKVFIIRPRSGSYLP